MTILWGNIVLRVVDAETGEAVPSPWDGGRVTGGWLWHGRLDVSSTRSGLALIASPSGRH